MPGVGSKIKQLVEQTREKLHLGEPGFRPTPNVRNPAMLQEAQQFAKVMASFRTAVTRYGDAVDSE